MCLGLDLAPLFYQLGDMIGYVALSEQMQEQEELLQDSDDVTVLSKVKMSHGLMEKCVKLYRKRQSHRNALDFNSSFIKGVLTKMEDL
jgi:hypothetical protein